MKITGIKITKFDKIFKSDASRFQLLTALKVTGICFLVSAFVCYLLWIMLAMNNVFFEANGYMGISELRTAYYDFILSTTIARLPEFILFCIILFFAGVYMSKILLRPFDIIKDYCEKAIENNNTVYNPDLFSDYKLLTRFSELFFQYLTDCRNKHELTENVFPPHFSKIHKPVFDRVFFFHFILFISIMAICTSSFILFVTGEIQGKMIDLAVKTLSSNSQSISYFLSNQEAVIDSVGLMTILLVVVFYIALAFHLYSKVSGAVFAFFSTMRAFMKGNYQARVHLIGFNHIRAHGRALNKYLDYICKEIEQHKKDLEEKSNIEKRN